MSNRKKKLSKEQSAGTTAAKRLVSPRIAVIIAVILVAAIVLPTALYIHSQNERGKLEAALTDAERKLKLQEDVAAAQQQESESLIQKLQDQLEEFLHVEDTAPVITSDQIKEMLSSASELVTSKYIYTNAARREASKTWLWGWTLPFSDTSLLVTYDGEIKAGIDFSAIQVSVNEATRTITVTLPPSKILNNDIPQESIDVLEVRNNLFSEITFDDYNEFIGAEKTVMQEKAISRGLLTEADREAESLIRAFLNLIPGIETYTLDIK